MLRFSLLALLLFASAAPAAPPVLNLPSTVSGKVGEFLTITATTDAAFVVFYPLDSGLNPVPPQMNNDVAKSFIALPFVEGSYRLLVYTGGADGPSQPAIVNVNIAASTVSAAKKLTAVAPAAAPAAPDSPLPPAHIQALPPAVQSFSEGSCTWYRVGNKWYSTCPQR